MSDEGVPSDILSMVTTDYNVGRIRTEMLSANLEPDEDIGIEFGIQIHQDGPDISLSSGSLYPDNPERKAFYTYHGLSPDQAREIATALVEAAELAESAREDAGREGDDPETFFERVRVAIRGESL
jgi:hypothetical protein